MSLNLEKSDDNFLALDDINIKLYDGEFTALLGPNGAGANQHVIFLFYHRMLAPDKGDCIINGYYSIHKL